MRRWSPRFCLHNEYSYWFNIFCDRTIEYSMTVLPLFFRTLDMVLASISFNFNVTSVKFVSISYSLLSAIVAFKISIWRFIDLKTSRRFFVLSQTWTNSLVVLDISIFVADSCKLTLCKWCIKTIDYGIDYSIINDKTNNKKRKNKCTRVIVWYKNGK